ncbi:hypothetical protein OG976_11695 [Mycobacterium sp. NBC_00419]|uniref:hypothetical protein n=1 Tax=Mycobacterium sp. NBC_00419 TaxID=2975989 RepID=UPI002E1C0952
MLGAGSAAGSAVAAPDDDVVVSVLAVTLAECATVVAFAVVASVAEVASVEDRVEDTVEEVVTEGSVVTAAAAVAVPEESFALVLPPDEDTLLLRAE